MIQRADLILGTTPVYLAESPYLQCVQYKTLALPIGIDPIIPSVNKVEEIRNKYKGKNIIFSLGRLVPYKGFRYLIEAAKFLPDDYIILIGGGGPLKEELQNEIKVLNLKDKVKLLGRIHEEELSSYYGACKLFCLSSIQKTEAFAIVQIEAMSCAKPVVATNIPHAGVSWVNCHGYSGLNVTPKSGKELADAIMKITEHEDVYDDFCKHALQRFKDSFTKDKMINTLLEKYKSLIS